MIALVLFCGLAQESVNPSQPGSPAEGKGPFAFCYFMGNGEDGLHLAWSGDGLRWQPLNAGKSYLSPGVGGKLMRDPSIARGPDGVFHMVWTTGWWDRGFGYASSKDLIHWTEQKYIPANEAVTGAKNTWAPDLFYDRASRQFVVLYATTIPGKFPETDHGGDHNHRQYMVTTKEFKTFTKPVIPFNPGHNIIDGTLFETPKGLGLIYKDERPGHKRLHLTTSESLLKPWKATGGPIVERDWVEGPTVLRVGTVWRVYFDCYTKGHYGAAESMDGIRWKDISDQVSFPKGARHGTAFPIPPETLKGLREKHP